MSHRGMENITSICNRYIYLDSVFPQTRTLCLRMKIEKNSDNFLLSLFKGILKLYMKYTLGVSDTLEEPEHPLLSLLKTMGSAYSCHCM